ncbi:hypothetical protein BX616_010808, partial [Lobosporangium transversale]
SQASKQDTVIETCLADFSDLERAYILDLFEKLRKGQIHCSADNDNSHKKEQYEPSASVENEEAIDPQHFNSYFSSLLPPALLTCFRMVMQAHSIPRNKIDDEVVRGSSNGDTHVNSKNQAADNSRDRLSVLTHSISADSTTRISKYGWVVTIHRLSKTNIEEQAGLCFMLQMHEKSLESFITNVTRAVMPFWLAGEIGSWMNIPEEGLEATTEFLLTRHLNLESPSEDNEFGDDLGIMKESILSVEDGDVQNAKGSSGETAQDWLKATQKQDVNSRPSISAFINWYQHSVEFQLMVKILIQNLFLGQSTLVNIEGPRTSGRRIKLTVEQENKLCEKNYIAPRIKGGIDVAPHFSRLLTVGDFFQLLYALPTPAYRNVSSSFGYSKGHEARRGPLSETRLTPPLRLLFSSKTSGASFSTLLQKITYQGPTVVVMKDEDGYIFGGYADQDWEQRPKFYGNDRNFLFTIRPKFRIYRPSSVNNHFQYMDYGTKTLPNGMGFGGQLRYFGLWLASDFQSGQSAAEPLCSTYQSPRLSKYQDFKLDEMEVWQVHPSLVEREEGPKRSAMDAHADAVALLEMANHKMYSKNVRAPDVYDSD